MDMDDDDSFLYGDQSPPAKPAAELPKAAAANGISDSMAASLAAYGIDPSVAVAEEKVVDEVPEDGGVEEEGDDDEDDESDSDDDDIKLVFTSGPQRTLDLRKPQQPQSNVIGIGKWAHTSTGAAPAAVSPIKPAPARSAAVAAATAAPDALTDYTPAARPGQAASAAAPAGSYDATQSQVIVAGNGPPPTTQLPHSTLAVQTVPSSTAPIDPTNPTGIIPSTGTSVYDVDTAQFEGSGQMWRRPGSDISDWFNYGFDEVTYPKFLKFRQEMEQGARALASLGPMGQITPDMAQMLHVQMAPNPQQLQQMQQMQMMAMQGMDPAAMFAMQNAQNMQGGGMGMGMMGNAMQQQQQQQMQQGLQRQGQQAPVPQIKQEEGGADGGESQGEIQQQAQVPPAMAGRGGHIAARGRGGAALRGRGGVPVGPRAAVLAGNIPKGPKAGRFKDKDRVAESAAAGTSLDYGDDPYGGGGGSGPGSHHERSRSASPARSDYRERDRRDRYEEREHRDDRHEERDRYGERDRDRSERSSSRRDYDDRHEEGSEGEYDERGGDRHGDRERDRERDDRYGSEREDRYGERDDRYGERDDRYGERDDRYGASSDRRSSRRDKRKRDDEGTSTPASNSGKAGLGPDGWESGEEEEQQQQRRSTRRRR